MSAPTRFVVGLAADVSRLERDPAVRVLECRSNAVRVALIAVSERDLERVRSSFEGSIYLYRSEREARSAWQLFQASDDARRAAS